MKPQTVRRIVWAAAYIGLLIAVGTITIAVPVWLGRPILSPLVTTVATALMVATLALQATILIALLTARGRAMVPVPMLGDDGWIFAIVSTSFPGIVWDILATQAAPFMASTMFEMVSPATAVASALVSPVGTSVLLLVLRVEQQRRMKAIHT